MSSCGPSVFPSGKEKLGPDVLQLPCCHELGSLSFLRYQCLAAGWWNPNGRKWDPAPFPSAFLQNILVCVRILSRCYHTPVRCVCTVTGSICCKRQWQAEYLNRKPQKQMLLPHQIRYKRPCVSLSAKNAASD